MTRSLTFLYEPQDGTMAYLIYLSVFPQLVKTTQKEQNKEITLLHPFVFNINKESIQPFIPNKTFAIKQIMSGKFDGIKKIFQKHL